MGINGLKKNSWLLLADQKRKNRSDLKILITSQMDKLVHMGVQCWGSGEGTPLPLMWPAGSNSGDDAICGLSLLLVRSFAPRGFSPGTPVFPFP